MMACNSNSGKDKDEAGFFQTMPVIDIERLHNQLATELLDSVAIQEYLKSTDLPEELQEPYVLFYKNRDFQPAWIDQQGFTTEAQELLEAIEACTEQGLNKDDYKLQYLYHLKKKLEKEDAGLGDYQKIEKELTGAYLNIARHILKGRIDPQQFDDRWKTDRRQKDLARHLQQALDEGDISAFLEALEPKFKGYQGLKEALQHYEKIAQQTEEWEKLPEDLVLTPGDSNEFVPQLAKMLYILGDAEKNLQDQELYDEEIAAALVNFQQRHGLAPDSILASKTIEMLNISPKRRLAQIKLNLERFRWMPERPEGRHLVVNVPEYMLHVYEGSDSIFSMRVIVGEAYESTTPVFNDTIEYITFSPTWTVPLGIAYEEMLPALQKDPNYLVDRNFKLYEGWTQEAEEVDSRKVKWKKVDKEDFSYRVVQQPGGKNSLGKVKFMFPNSMDIYLHDTPADYLFDNTERDFSHGCVRVEKPTELAQYLLQDKGWDRQKINEYMHKEEPVDVPLSEKVPVFIEYHTSWMGSDGNIHFREDVYGHDSKQMEPLQEAIDENEELVLGVVAE